MQINIANNSVDRMRIFFHMLLPRSCPSKWYQWLRIWLSRNIRFVGVNVGMSARNRHFQTNYWCITICGCLRLLHIPSLVANGLSMRCETLHPIGWHLPFVIDWFKYRIAAVPMNCELTWPVGISTVLQRLPTVPLYSLKGCARRLSKSLDGYVFPGNTWPQPTHTARGLACVSAQVANMCYPTYWY